MIAMASSDRSQGWLSATLVERPRSDRQKITANAATVITIPATAAGHISRVNAGAAMPSTRTDSKLVRFDTGSSSEAVFASQIAV